MQSEFVSASTWPYPAFDSPCSLASLGLLTLLPTFFFFLEILSFLKLSIPFWLLFFTLAPCLAQCLLLIFIATSSILLSLICIAGDVTSSCSINFYITSTILSSWRSPRPLVPTYWTMPLHFHAVISVFWGTKRIIFLFIKRSHAAGELLNTMLSMNPHLISTAVIGFNMMIVLTVLWAKLLWPVPDSLSLLLGLSLYLLNQFYLKTLDFCSTGKMPFPPVSEHPSLTMLLLHQGSSLLTLYLTHSPIQIYCG